MTCNFKHIIFILLLIFSIVWKSFGQELGKEIITVKPGSWRSATVFTHLIWNDILFYGGGAGKDGGDPRHEIEIGAFHLVAPDSGFHNKNNPVITRKQFGLEQPGKGITPLSIFDRGDSLFMFCTSRPNDDLQPRIVQISANVSNPLKWGNYKIIVDESFSGKMNNHGASVLIDPDNPDNVLLYFAAGSSGDDYRILLASAPIAQISSPSAYKLLNGYNSAVLARKGAKTNYPFVCYNSALKTYELWYSGQSLENTKNRSCFKTISPVKDRFQPSHSAVVNASGINSRNDKSYATGPKVYGNDLYYSGRKNSNGNYVAIFYLQLDGLNQ